jgi:restriction endonuclease Mrr
MRQEREHEQNLRKKEYQDKIAEVQKQSVLLDKIKKELYSLFGETNFQKRGKTLETVLNNYFKAYQILVKEDFKRVGESGDGIIEQIDGIVEIDNLIYLVEMKWKKDSVGSDDIFSHLGRIYHRANAHGIFISASGYSASGLTAAKEALVKNALLIMFDLEELVRVIEDETDFRNYLRDKIKLAIIEKEPYKRIKK